MFSSQVPLLFSILFLVAFTVPVVMVAKLAYKGGIKNALYIIPVFYFVYLTAVSLASINGFFDQVMLPPKIVLTTTLPFAVFATFIYTTKACKRATENLALSDLVSVHIFRLIGSTFIILYIYELLPVGFALFAGIGDLLTAITSIYVSRTVKNNKAFAKRLVLLWNTFGLLDILITSALAIIFTKISIDTGQQGVEFLANFPFCFIPAFAPPTIILLHLLVYRKLKAHK